MTDTTTDPTTDPDVDELDEMVSTPPVMSNGGRSFDFAGTRWRCEAMASIEDQIAAVAFVHAAVDLAVMAMTTTPGDHVSVGRLPWDGRYVVTADRRVAGDPRRHVAVTNDDDLVVAIRRARARIVEIETETP